MTGLRRLLRFLPRNLRRQKLLSALVKTRLVPPIQLLEFNDNAMAWVDLRDGECRANYLAESFWPEFHPMVAAFLRDGGELFDVGANFGLVTFGVVPLIDRPIGGFHLFEANPEIVPLLHRSAELRHKERFEISHCCVSDERGLSRLHLPDGLWGHGYIAEDGAPVQNLLLDGYIESRSIERVAFLKMDIEGWELKAIRGAQRSSAAGKIQAGFIEVAPEALARAGSSAPELLQFLQALGFDPYFSSLLDHPDPFGLSWRRVSVNGTSLRFAAVPILPSGFVQGDLLVVHRANPLSSRLRDAFRD